MRSIVTCILLGALMTLNFNCTSKRSGDEISIIPKPYKIRKSSGSFVFTSETKIYLNSEDNLIKGIAEFFTEITNRATGYETKIIIDKKSASDIGNIQFILSESEKGLGEEGYKLNIDVNSIELTAYKLNGLFYGVQTLRQLLPQEIERGKAIPNFVWSVPCLKIEDKPRFNWRGMHLDVCRHFYPKEFVKKYIDLIALHKMNVFHWHLTEDQGWRIEIKKYPKLTEVGAWRVDREDKNWREREPST